MALEQDGTKPPTKNSDKKKLKIMISESALVAIGVALIIMGLITQQEVAEVTAGKPDLTPLTVSNETVLSPDEKKPDVEIQKYEVANHLPRRIIIPGIDANGFIQQVGLTQENVIASPANVHVAGWYNKSVLPGDKGLSIIDGHVSGSYTDGIFKNLKRLYAGQTFAVEFGDRSQKTFEVIEVKTMAEKQSAAFLLDNKPSIESQLNLITCGGEFDSESETYKDRVIVVSRLAEGQ